MEPWFHHLCRLQWGRPFYGAESWFSRNSVRLLLASMGPPFLRGGEPLHKGHNWGNRKDPTYASMGPPFLRGGESGIAQRALDIRNKSFNGAALFTGRRDINEENEQERPDFMLQWGRPFYGAERKQRSLMEEYLSVLLQWGRPFYGAERLPFGYAVGKGVLTLQWGRPFYGAERGENQSGYRSLFKFPKKEFASMGPPFLRGGESDLLQYRVFETDKASMGPPFLRGGERKTVIGSVTWLPNYSCFNGAALFTGRRV